jgi:hypothetical protein
MMKKNLILVLLLLVAAIGAQAQVLIGAEGTPDPTAVLELRSTNKGLLLPQVRLDAADDVSKLTTPVAGMLVYNRTGALQHGIYFWNGEVWVLYIGFSE